MILIWKFQLKSGRPGYPSYRVILTDMAELIIILGLTSKQAYHGWYLHPIYMTIPPGRSSQIQVE
jgi:hypothetical protein